MACAGRDCKRALPRSKGTCSGRVWGRAQRHSTSPVRGQRRPRLHDDDGDDDADDDGPVDVHDDEDGGDEDVDTAVDDGDEADGVFEFLIIKFS